jgi:hypothetical protein
MAKSFFPPAMLFLLLHAAAVAQPIRQMYTGIETGTSFYNSQVSELGRIRSDSPDYADYYSQSSIYSHSHRLFTGVKFEVFSFDDRLSFQTGLRYLQYTASIGKAGYYRNSSNYFYWQAAEFKTYTEYFRLKGITQKSSYLGIPVEVRFFVSKRPKLIAFYAKIGADIFHILSTKADVIFDDERMSIYSKLVVNELKEPSSINGSIYGAGGFRIGRELKPSVSVELNVAMATLNPGANGIIKHKPNNEIPNIGAGVQFNLQFPINNWKD